jgi:hypothetical protein
MDAAVIRDFRDQSLQLQLNAWEDDDESELVRSHR